MSLFVPRISVMADYDAQANQRRADRIAAIRARLADGWRHPAWEAGLYEAERRVRANSPHQARAIASRAECGCSASPDWRMAAEMKRKHDDGEDMEGRLCNPEI